MKIKRIPVFLNLVGIFYLLNLLISCSGNISDSLDKDLAGHWPLNGDARDISGSGRDAIINGNIDFNVAGPDGAESAAALFNGTNAFLEIPSGKSPQPATEDFSISVRINISDASNDVTGDIISKYDPVNRKGFILSVKDNAVTTSMTNSGQLFFGIDNDRVSGWVDCGRPGNAVCAFSMTSYRGDLYAGTCEAGKTESGHVYRYNGLDRWIDCGAPDSSNSVMALAVYNNKIYAGTAKYRLAGSSLTESENSYLGGRIFSYEGEQNWRYCGQLPGTEAIGGLIVYKGSLYASSLYHPAGFFRYEGDTTWTDCGTPDGKRVVALAVYNGYIWASSYDGGFVYRYDGNSWTGCGQLGDNTQTYSFTVYRGRLFVGTWPSGRVYRFEDINSWTDMGRLGDELEVMGMIVHNGRLVAGTLPLAEIYSYEGDTVWGKVARIDNTPDVRYRRAWIMAENDGKVFCSTLPSGKIFSSEFGKNVISNDPVTPGWHHIVAAKSNDQITLYLDGKEIVKSGTFDNRLYNLDNEAPLYIGFGPNDYFNGSMADLRLYNRTLTANEIRLLSDTLND
ncbi:MAG: LamG domain-containing protein [Prolixibacteraceae bacterium]|nr:LamG domain-containing protein [Prolixibacteraceae bacterium]